jgi:hypothetical protein
MSVPDQRAVFSAEEHWLPWSRYMDPSKSSSWRQGALLVGVMAILAVLGVVLAGRWHAQRLPGSSSGTEAPASTGPRRATISGRAAPSRHEPAADSEPRSWSGLVVAGGSGREEVPLPGASVCLIFKGAERRPGCVVTDRLGSFVFSSGADEPEARLVASAVGYRSVTTVLEAAADRRVRLVLEAGGVEISGTVVDATGGFVVGAQVAARQPGSNEALAVVLTGEAGGFRLSVAPGLVELVAVAEAYSRALHRLSGPRDGVVLALVPASGIRGEVVLESGEPLSGARVLATNKNGVESAPVSVRADATGRFVFSELPAGGYELTATAERWRARPEWVTVAVAQTASVKLVVGRAWTASIVLDVDGVPCASGEVLLDGPVTATEPVGPNGQVRFEGLARGRYAVSARCTGTQQRQGMERRAVSATLEEVLIVDRDDTTEKWSLVADRLEETSRPDETPERGASISGRVLDESGDPVPEAWVTASGNLAPSSAPALSDDTGSFVLTGLPSGRHELSATSSVGQGRRANVMTQSTNVLIRLETYGAISGTVESANGARPDVFTLVYRNNDAQSIQSTIGSEGAWSLPWLPAGSYRLSAIGPGSCGWVDTRLGPGGSERVTIRLDQTGDVCHTIWRF